MVINEIKEMKDLMYRLYTLQSCEMKLMINMLNDFFNLYGGHAELAMLRKVMPAVLESGDIDILIVVIGKILTWMDKRNANFNDDLSMYISPAEGSVLVLK